MDCSSFSSPGRWNHRLSFPSNFFGISIRLDFVETLKIRLNGPHNSLFDPAFPYLKNSPSSWMDLIVFPVIFSESCKRTHVPCRARDWRHIFQQVHKLIMRIGTPNQNGVYRRSSGLDPGTRSQFVSFHEGSQASRWVRILISSSAFIIGIFLTSFFVYFQGINRHFHMACIHDKFATSTGKRNISSKQIWEHLQELYNLQALVSFRVC